MEQGTIARLTDRGFGFISRDGEEDLFFHANELQNVDYDQLQEGDAVTFEVTEGPKGLNATNVSKAEDGDEGADAAEAADASEAEEAEEE